MMMTVQFTSRSVFGQVPISANYICVLAVCRCHAPVDAKDYMECHVKEAQADMLDTTLERSDLVWTIISQHPSSQRTVWSSQTLRTYINSLGKWQMCDLGFTVTDTLAQSYLPATSASPGGAAEAAAERKVSNTCSLLQCTCTFVSIAVETMGPINSYGLQFFSDLGRLISQALDDHCESAFLFQRLSVLIQRFNAVAIAKIICNTFACMVI